MLSSAVLNNSTREKLGITLRSFVEEWIEKWFTQKDAVSVDIDFNNTLFKQKMLDHKCETIVLPQGKIAIVETAASREEMAKHALMVESKTDEKDVALYNELGATILFELFSAIAKKSGVSDNFQFSADVQAIQPAISVHIKHKDKTLLNCLFDKEALNHLQLLTANELPRTAMNPNAIAQASMKGELTVQAQLESIRLSLEEILRLKKGSVIKLTHPLNRPIVLATSQKPLPVNACLVSSKGKRSLLLKKGQNTHD